MFLAGIGFDIAQKNTIIGKILGLQMDAAKENLIISMAKEAGIKNIYKSYIIVAELRFIPLFTKMVSLLCQIP